MANAGQPGPVKTAAIKTPLCKAGLITAEPLAEFSKNRPFKTIPAPQHDRLAIVRIVEGGVDEILDGIGLPLLVHVADR